MSQLCKVLNGKLVVIPTRECWGCRHRFLDACPIAQDPTAPWYIRLDKMPTHLCAACCVKAYAGPGFFINYDGTHPVCEDCPVRVLCMFSFEFAEQND